MMLRTAEVAELFGVHHTTVLHWIAKGRIQSTKLGPGRTDPHVFDPAAVRQFGDDLRTIHYHRTAA